MKAFAGRSWVVVPLLVLWVGWVRIGSFDRTLGDADEALFLLIGRDWDLGHPPYAGIWDVKPPGLFALFALLRLVFDPGILAARALTAGAVAATTIGLWHFARRNLAGVWTPALVALTYPAYTVTLSGLRSVPELLLAPFVVAGLSLAMTETHAVLAGLAFGCAIMIKQTAGFETGLGFVLIVGAVWHGRQPWHVLVGFVAGVLLPAAVFLAAARIAGEPWRMALTPVLAAVGRVGDDGISVGQGLVNFVALLKPLLPLVVAALLLWPERRGWTKALDRRAIRIVLAWLATSAAAIVVMHATYPHYLIPLLPPLTLAGAVALRLIGERSRALVPILLGAGLIVYPLGWWLLVDRPAQFSADLARSTADALHRLGLRPGEAIYVVDQDPAIYLLADAAVPTRFALPFHLMCDVKLPEVDPAAEIARIMASRPRFVVISQRRREMVCEHADRVALVDAALARDYHLVDTVGPAGLAADLYCRAGDCDRAASDAIPAPQIAPLKAAAHDPPL